MKKALLLSISCLLLSACTAGTELTYLLQFDTEDAARQTMLTAAAVNVVKRRTVRLEEDLPEVGISEKEEGTALTVEVASESADVLHEELIAPFVVDFMVQAEEGETFDATVEGHGNFRKTELAGEHIDVVAPRQDETDATKGRLVLAFTQTGSQVMQTVFTENKGKYIGLFVRGQLAAKIMVEETVPQEAIIISGLPSVELAEVFADDVNVGLHVTFIPLE